MITLVIPVRNRAELVGRTLASIGAQTRQPAQTVLVDNGSTDGSMDVLRAWAEGRENVEVISEPRPGAAVARNAGAARARTPYIMFFDSDDVMPPRHIEEIMRGLRQAGMPELAAFDVAITDRRGRRSLKPYRAGEPLRMQIFHSTFTTQRMVIAADLWRRAGGWNESLRGWDDLELGARLIVNAQSVCGLRLSEPVEIYQQAESITGTDFASKAGEWERALDAIALLPGAAKMVAQRRAILAGEYLREGRPDLAGPLTPTAGLRLIARYVALGGRGVERLLRIFA